MIYFLKEFEGIVGTILGVAVTFLGTIISKSFGSIKVKGYKEELKFIKNGEDMEGYPLTVEVDNIKEATCLTFNFKVTFYNSSEIPKTLHSFEIEFTDSKNKKLKHFVYDADKEEHNSNGVINRKLRVLEVEPKSMVLKNLYGDIKQSDGLYQLTSSKIIKVHLLSKNYKGKVNRKTLFELKKGNEYKYI